MPARRIHPISHDAARKAIDRVWERRNAAEDPHREALPVAPHDEGITDEPLTVAEYVLKHTRVPTHVLACDVVDALLLVEYARAHVPAVPGTLDALEGRLLALGAATDVTWAEMGKPVGVHHRQTMEQRLLRYASGLRGADRTPHAERAARREHARRSSWLQRHGASFLALVDQVLAAPERLPEDAAEAAKDLQYSRRLLPARRSHEYPDRFGNLVTRVVLLAEDVPPGQRSTALARLVKLTESWKSAQS